MHDQYPNRNLGLLYTEDPINIGWEQSCYSLSQEHTETIHVSHHFKYKCKYTPKNVLIRGVTAKSQP